MTLFYLSCRQVQYSYVERQVGVSEDLYVLDMTKLLFQPQTY